MNGIKPPSGPSPQGMQLYDAEGRRLYLTEEERRAFIVAAAKASREVRTFCGVLHATGCRISEALALSADRIVNARNLRQAPSSYASHPCTPTA